jgi:hypothetical protein
MKLRYDVTVEDLVEFNLYYCEHSSSTRRSKTLIQWGFPLLTLLLSLVILFSIIPPDDADENHELVLGLTILLANLVFTIYWVFMWPIHFRNSVARRSKKLYTEGTATGTVGDHELELTETDLVESDSSRITRTRLSTIEKVVINGDYTYIFLNSFTAYVVPHEAVSSGDLKLFVETLKRRISVERA